MHAFVDKLMSQMTLVEKLGQLNLPVGGDIVTGGPHSSLSIAAIREGKVGGLFNLKGAASIREIQRIAVEESRMGIPLLFGMDVIHGYETVFPIPLALSCSWDMDAIARSAQIAAREATADGINWTFSPMVDICHDGRWGRISEAKYKLGLFDDPYRYCDDSRREAVVLCDEHRAEARRIAGECMVLLKNERDRNEHRPS